METVLAVLAAAVASAFAVDLSRSAVQRPRLHAKVWAVAMTFFALATWALAAGLGLGWTVPIFRAFYWLGAIANIPLLAAGSVALSAGETWGRRMAAVVAVFIALGGVVTLLAPLNQPVTGVAVPEGSELFDFTVEIGTVTVPGPRVFAVVAGSVGTLLIVGFAATSAIRAWPGNRRLSLGNVLIVVGALAPALGGSLTALGEGGGLAVSLLVGAVLLYAGYRVAVSARASGAPRVSA